VNGITRKPATPEELSVCKRFEDGEVASDHGYFSGHKPKGIAEQAHRLRALFPGIGSADKKLASSALPPNAEGWFAISRWEKIAPTFNAAAQKVLDMIKQTRGGKFYNFLDGQLGPEHFRQTAKTAEALEMLGHNQKNNGILVIPAQFGVLHRGRSVHRVREILASNESRFDEFALDVVSIGSMLLTHPERLRHDDDLWIDCPGSEFDDPNSTVRFSRVPSFRFYDGKVWFVTRRGSAHASYGSATAFIPK
jgi:hypothetical protein